MLLLYTGCALAGPWSTLVPPPWCPNRSCSRHRMFVDRNEKRDLISRAVGAQIPNPGFVSRHTQRDILDLSPRVGAVGGHFAAASLQLFGATLQGASESPPVAAWLCAPSRKWL